MNVLFIEDDRMNRRVVRDMLDVAGATMAEAESAEIGLDMIDRETYHKRPGKNRYTKSEGYGIIYREQPGRV